MRVSQESDGSIRISGRARWTDWLRFLFLCPAAFDLYWHGSAGPPPEYLPPAWMYSVFWAMLVVGVAFAVASWAWDNASGITLTATHAFVHNVRSRALAWTDVQAVDLTTGSLIVLRTARGKVKLRGPSGHRDGNEAAAMIIDWWLRHGGRPQQPPARALDDPWAYYPARGR